jgi:protein arginine phosphatase
MMRILFVCTGNTCRSPMAEAILKSKAIDGVEVKSAGVFAINGSPASAHAKTVLGENNIPENHSSAYLTEEELEWATYVFTMTEGHKTAVLSKYPHASEKTFTLKEFAENNPAPQDIVDPYGGSLDLYRETFEDIHRAIEKIIGRLENERL